MYKGKKVSKKLVKLVNKLSVLKNKCSSKILDRIKTVYLKNNLSYTYEKYSKQSSINNEKVLFLKVPKEHIIEIDYSRDYIVEKTNSYFGYSFINKVIINSFKVSKAKNDTVNKAPILNEKLSKKIKLIKNEKLQNAFNEFFKNDK